MTLSKQSSLADVAVVVGDALRRTGIRAVLTGGACADLYSKGASQSFDADFIISGRCETKDVDSALEPLGFTRKQDRYVHNTLPFHVEFPGGPLGIGQDLSIKPILKRRKGATTLALSATDSCRDRLGWFYYFKDQQSLKVAVAIALSNKLALARIEAWSVAEGHAAGYMSFISELRRARLRKRRR